MATKIVPYGRWPTSTGATAILTEAIETASCQCRRDGTIVDLDEIQPAWTRYKATGDLVPIAAYAGAIARAFPDYWVENDKPGTAESIKMLDNQYFADAAYVALNAAESGTRAAYAAALTSQRKTPSYRSTTSCLREARTIVPKAPNGKPYGLNGCAYRPHEVAAALKEFKVNGDLAAFARFAGIISVAFPDYAAGLLRKEILGRWLTPQTYADMASIALNGSTAAIRKEAIDWLANCRT
jgi:hypothetical protein